MKLLKSEPFEGKYLFHLHTDWTDGEVSIEDYFQFAKKAGVSQILFLEHIRYNPQYDVQKFVLKVRQMGGKYDVQTYVGFEAKIMLNGFLDCADEFFEMADIIGLAEHGFSGGFSEYQNAFDLALSRYCSFAAEKPLIWVHPGALLKKWKLLEKERLAYISMLKKAIDYGLRIERNIRYDLIPFELVKLAGRSLVLGLDAHKHADLSVWPYVFNDLWLS